jgi:hypothetical protein
VVLVSGSMVLVLGPCCLGGGDLWLCCRDVVLSSDESSDNNRLGPGVLPSGQLQY